MDADVAFFVERHGGLSLPHVATRRAHLDQPRDIYGVLEAPPNECSPFMERMKGSMRLYSAGTRSNHGCALSSSAASASRVASSP
jgi:hypothetical protein